MRCPENVLIGCCDNRIDCDLEAGHDGWHWAHDADVTWRKGKPDGDGE